MFANIGCREPQPQASEVFTTFGEAHRSIERYAIKMLKTVKPVSHITTHIHYCVRRQSEDVLQLTVNLLMAVIRRAGGLVCHGGWSGLAGEYYY